MKLFQLIVMFAVLSANVHWQWTPNGYLAGLLALGAAWAVTIVPLWVIDRVLLWNRPQ